MGIVLSVTDQDIWELFVCDRSRYMGIVLSVTDLDMGIVLSVTYQDIVELLRL